jgi:hypothetical protein
MLYVVLMECAYVTGIVPLWSYLGFLYAAPPMWLWTAATAAAMIPALWMPVRLSRPSQWLYLYIYLAVFVPACFVPVFRGTSLGQPNSGMAQFVAVLLVCMAVLGLPNILPLLKIPRLRLHSSAPYWLVIG